jgi:hypothetical protein
MRRMTAYEFTTSRAGIHPQSFVAGWQGYLVADAYTGYDRLFANPALKEVGCWAHARRKFFEVANDFSNHWLQKLLKAPIIWGDR